MRYNKEVDGKTYSLTETEGDLAITDPTHYWLSADGDRLELSDEELEELDDSRSIADD